MSPETAITMKDTKDLKKDVVRVQYVVVLPFMAFMIFIVKRRSPFMVLTIGSFLANPASLRELSFSGSLHRLAALCSPGFSQVHGRDGRPASQNRKDVIHCQNRHSATGFARCAAQVRREDDVLAQAE